MRFRDGFKPIPYESVRWAKWTWIILGTRVIFFPLVCRSPLQPAYAQLGAVRQIGRMGRFWLPKESDMQYIINVTVASVGFSLFPGA